MQYHWAVVRAANRVKLSKLNQTGSTWTEFLSEENVFFYYFYTLRTDRLKMNSFNLLNYHRRVACRRASVCIKISFHSGNHMAPGMGSWWRFLSRGVLHIMTYMGRLLAKAVPFLFFRYTKELEISLAEVYERVGKCVISVSKKVQKD